jgi:hypothetical protein
MMAADLWQAVTMAGDFSHNGKVDAADYVVWLRTLGSTTDLRADGNNDGAIDQLDRDVWRANFGNTVELPPVNTAPTLTGIADQHVIQGHILTLDISAADINSDALAFSARALGANGDPIDMPVDVIGNQLTINTAGFSGSAVIELTASDGQLSETTTFSLNVAASDLQTLDTSRSIVNPRPGEPPAGTALAAAVNSVGRVSDFRGGFGSGTLISPRHVLTAAHVVDSGTSALTTFDLNGVSYNVARIILHPNYQPALNNGTDSFVAPQNDIAILELTTAIPTSVALPSPILGHAPAVGSSMVLVGFGRINLPSGGLGDAGIRRWGVTPLEQITGQHLSWRLDNSRESNISNGDSGGPSFVFVNGRWNVAGVHSFSSVHAASIGARGSDVRADVYSQWIDSFVSLRYDGTSPVIQMLQYRGGVLTAFRNTGAGYRIHWSPNGSDLGHHSQSTTVYDGTSAVIQMMEYGGKVYTAFQRGPNNYVIHRSDDHTNLGGGAIVYEGYSPVIQMLATSRGIYTAFANAGPNGYRIHRSVDGNSLGVHSSATTVYDGSSRVIQMVEFNGAVFTSFHRGANDYVIHRSDDHSSFGGGTTVYQGNSPVIQMLATSRGIYTSFSHAGPHGHRIHRSLDGYNLGVHSSSTTVYDGITPVIQMVEFNGEIYTAFGDGRSYRIHRSQNGSGLGSGSPLYDGFSPVVQMLPHDGEILTAFSNAGPLGHRIHRSILGRGLGGPWGVGY